MEPFVIHQLPFDSGFSSDRKAAHAERFDFTLDIDPSTGVIVQCLDGTVRAVLKKYYEVGGYGSTPLGEGEYATRQAADIIEVIRRCLASAGKRIETSDFLEIGSSYGYLLYVLKQAGAKSVLGVEPGDEGVIGGGKYGIPVIQDFFPTGRLTWTFDVIFSHAVLEHIEEPLKIVKDMADKLNPGGLVFAAVPDCEKKMRMGDSAILSHQHVNYFTERSLRSLLTAAGFRDVVTIPSGRRSILYGWGTKPEHPPSGDRMPVTTDEDLLALFADAFGKNIRSMQEIVDESECGGKRIGLYGSGVVSKGLLTFRSEPRLFDTDVAKHGKKMAGVGASIEPPQALLSEPVDTLFVCPIDYDKEIVESLRRMCVSEKTRMVSLKAIFERNSGFTYDVNSMGDNAPR